MFGLKHHLWVGVCSVVWEIRGPKKDTTKIEDLLHMLGCLKVKYTAKCTSLVKMIEH